MCVCVRVKLGDIFVWIITSTSTETTTLDFQSSELNNIESFLRMPISQGTSLNVVFLLISLMGEASRGSWVKSGRSFRHKVTQSEI